MLPQKILACWRTGTSGSVAGSPLATVLVTLGLTAGLMLGTDARATPQLPIVLNVDPGGTWLRVSQDFRRSPTRLDLASSNITAGDKLILHELGGYDCSLGNGCGIRDNMIAVFVDADGNLMLPDPALPVPSVPTPPTYFDGIPTDVPQDFFVPSTGGVAVIVPAGAAALLFGPDDSHFSDNVSHGYGVYIGCGAEVDSIIAEYDATAVNLTPKCRDFTQKRHSFYFSFAEINTGDFAWGLIRAPLIDSSLTYIGLDAWRNSYGGSRIINSAYRNPVHNASIGGATSSRHMFGDATDLRNASGTMTEYNAMRSAAKAAHADYIEPVSGPCTTKCVHADWRNHSGAYHD